MGVTNSGGFGRPFHLEMTMTITPSRSFWKFSYGGFKRNDPGTTPIWDRHGKYQGYWRVKPSGDNSGQWRDEEFIKARKGECLPDLTEEEMKEAKAL